MNHWAQNLPELFNSMATCSARQSLSPNEVSARNRWKLPQNSRYDRNEWCQVIAQVSTNNWWNYCLKISFAAISIDISKKLNILRPQNERSSSLKQDMFLDLDANLDGYLCNRSIKNILNSSTDLTSIFLFVRVVFISNDWFCLKRRFHWLIFVRLDKFNLFKEQVSI